MAAPEAFLDTSVLYALIDRKDAHHSAAREAVERLLRDQRRLLTTDYIVTEAVNLANAARGTTLPCGFWISWSRPQASASSGSAVFGSRLRRRSIAGMPIIAIHSPIAQASL